MAYRILRFPDVIRRIGSIAQSVRASLAVSIASLAVSIMSWSVRFFDVVRWVGSIVRIVRAPLVVSVLSYFVFSAPTQLHEVYRVLLRNPGEYWFQLALAGISLVALVAFLSRVTQQIINDAFNHDELLRIGLGRKIVLRTLPGILGALPVVGIASGTIEGILNLGQLRISALIELSGTGVISRDLVPPGAVEYYQEWDLRPFVALAILVLATTTWSVVRAFQNTARLTGHPPSSRSFFRDPLISKGLPLLALVLVVVFALQSADVAPFALFQLTLVAQWIGTIAIACAFLGCLTYILTLMTRGSESSRLPLVFIAFVYAAILSWIGVNHNQAFRTVSTTSAPVRTLSDGFIQWLSSRPTEYRNAFVKGGRKYPVYVVAAEGGGMTAANHVALVMARLFDRCPDLGHHVFAISAVSGGSLGAAMFVGVKDHIDKLSPPRNGKAGCNISSQQPTATYEQPLMEIMRTDFLAPTAASGLFPDFVQRFLPFSIPPFDRSRALEKSFETAWTRTMGSKSNPLREPFRQHWNPTGQAPMLLLNTTGVSSGSRLVIAPYGPLLPDLDLKVDAPLSTAVGLSARFPFVLPAGALPKGILLAVEDRITDGGVFENSGVETALDVIARLQTLLRNKVEFARSVEPTQGEISAEELGFYNGVEFRLIIVGGAFVSSPNMRPILRPDGRLIEKIPDSGDDEAGPRLYELAGASRSGLVEVGSPIRAMLNSRVSRGETAVSRALRSFNSETVQHAWKIALPYQSAPLPLGWQVSRRTQSLISAFVGSPERCLGAPMLDSIITAMQQATDSSPNRTIAAEEALWQLNINSCRLCSILRDVAPNAQSGSADRPCAP